MCIPQNWGLMTIVGMEQFQSVGMGSSVGISIAKRKVREDFQSKKQGKIGLGPKWKLPPPLPPPRGVWTFFNWGLY